jgi:hypothetical protein
MSVAAYFGNPPEKPKEKAMKFEDFLTAAKDFVKSGEFKLESALDLFGAKDKLITDKQKAALDALGEDDPKALKDQLAEAKKKAVNAELDEAFGKDGNLRMYADEQIEKGKTVDEIRKMPIAVALAAERAAGIDQIVEQKPKDEQTTVGDKIIASY